ADDRMEYLLRLYRLHFAWALDLLRVRRLHHGADLDQSQPPGWIRALPATACRGSRRRTASDPCRLDRAAHPRPCLRGHYAVHRLNLPVARLQPERHPKRLDRTVSAIPPILFRFHHEPRLFCVAVLLRPARGPAPRAGGFLVHP